MAYPIQRIAKRRRNYQKGGRVEEEENLNPWEAIIQDWRKYQHPGDIPREGGHMDPRSEEIFKRGQTRDKIYDPGTRPYNIFEEKSLDLEKKT
jgi:hypothetical protein